ncbi:MAG: MetS family NSS transporter small subunit [Microbacterium gubbeenense]|nr:MetS family NSS transporter small subunit [Microbacterium gubbeenense]
MSAIAILFLIIAAVIVWGGLAASIAFLVARPETSAYPEGGAGDDVG